MGVVDDICSSLSSAVEKAVKNASKINIKILELKCLVAALVAIIA